MTNKRKIQRVKKAQARPERIRMQKRSTVKRMARIYAPTVCTMQSSLLYMALESRKNQIYLAKSLELAQELENCRKQLKTLEAD